MARPSTLRVSALMSIGEVLNELRPEFPDVTISKIRFLETEGLVEPARTPSGYRKFSHADIERLRYVLAAQRDFYLPLKVIREHLEALDHGLEPPGLPTDRPRLPEPARARTELRLSRAELLRSSGLDEQTLAEVEEFGLLEPLPGRAGEAEQVYDADALAVAKAVAELGAFGLEPRHLRAFRSAAEREIDLIGQVVGPLLRQRSPQARSRAEEVARELGAATVRLHTALVRARMRRVTGP